MEIEDLRSLDQDQLAHGCIGYLKPDGKPTILIVGGENSATERITQMLEYDITSNTYSTKPPLNVAASRQVPVIKNNYLYLFGGNREDFGVVQRVELSLTKSWERLEDLVKKPRVALTVPYN